MIDLIGCITAFIIVLLLSKVEFIGDKGAKISTIRGWVIALFFAKVGL